MMLYIYYLRRHCKPARLIAGGGVLVGVRLVTTFIFIPPPLAFDFFSPTRHGLTID
jgi:hypothetical protein